MLQNPGEFSTAVQALFATQKQAIAAGKEKSSFIIKKALMATLFSFVNS